MLISAPRPAQTESATTPREQQDELALELARKTSACTPQRGSFPLPDRLKKLTEFFQLNYHYFDEAAKTQISVSHAAEWLLDNFYVLEQAIRQLEENMPMDYYQRLPKTTDSWTRIYILALGITRRDDARIDIEQIVNFTQTFQSITPLRISELWALPLMLRLTVLEMLAEGLTAISKLNWDTGPQPILWQTIRSTSKLTPTAKPSQPAAETMVVNSILNLRLLATQNWKAFFETTNVIERILQNDPVNVYAQMDFETRNHYRSVIEELAHGSSAAESAIASQAVQLAQAGISTREKHVGYYLIGPGREKLETQIQYHPQFFGLVTRFIQKYATATDRKSVV